MPLTKVSTGYLASQAKHGKKAVSKPQRSDSSDDSSSQLDEVFNKLMENPSKRKMILRFLNSNKDAINQYKKQKAREDSDSPLMSKVKKRVVCESPTALYRRKALEQMEKGSASSSDTNSKRSESRQSEASRSSSRQSELSSERSSPILPFDKIMQGVVAYVEIKSKGQDRSEGAKAILRSMGATVKDQFTKDVTHVVFKDGSFKTFQKAKLMKVHMVSILWVEFSRKSQFRQKESQYPPISAENNISTVCSQMHKEYEDIIREEYRRSIVNGTPLPSSQYLRDRRRTIMTTSVSSNSYHSVTSKISDDVINSQVSADKEVEAITKHKPSHNIIQTPNSDEIVVLNSPEVISESGTNVSDSGATVNAKILNQQTKTNIFASVMKSIENIKEISSSDMDITCSDTSKSLISNVSHRRQLQLRNPINGRSSNSKTPQTPVARKESRSIVSVNQESSSLNNNVSSVITNKSNEITQIHMPSFKNVTSRKKNDKSSKTSSKSVSTSDVLSNSMCLSNNEEDVLPAVQILSQNAVSTRKKQTSKPSERSTSLSTNISKSKSTESIPSLKLSDKSKSRSIDMSSLRVSGHKNNYGNVTERSKSSSMSALIVSDAKSNDKTGTERSKSTNLSSLRLSNDKNDKLGAKRSKSTTMSSLRVSDAKSSDKTGTERSKSTNLSSLRLSNDKNYKHGAKRSKSTTMSSLRVSDAKSSDKSGTERSKSTTNMSSLRVSDPKLNSQNAKSKDSTAGKKSFDTEDFPLIDNDFIEQALQALESPDKSVAQKKNISSKRSTPNSSSDTASVKNTVADKEKTAPRRISLRNLVKILEGKKDQDRAGEVDLDKNKRVVGSNKSTSPCKNGGDICNNGTCQKCADVLTDDDSDDSEIITATPIKPRPKSHTQKEKQCVKDKKGTKDKLALDSSSSKKPKENIAKGETIGEELPRNRRSTKTRKTLRTVRDDVTELDSAKSTKVKIVGPNICQSSEDTDESGKKRKKIRKLYNPNESLKHPSDSDEKEREEKRKQVLISAKKRKSLSVILMPLFPRENEKDRDEGNNTSDDDLELELLPNTPKRKKKEKQTKKVDYNSSQDEQRDLLDEVLRKKTKEDKPQFKTPSQITLRRRSVRLESQTKNSNKHNNPSSESVLPITPIKRRSTLDFQSVNVKSSIKKFKVNKSKMSTIVCTKLHKNDVQLFNQIVKKLGRFTVEDEVSSKTTHVVAGEPKRTINMLRAVARGCWVVKFDWVLKSLEAERWLPEEDFEETEFAAVVQQARIQREAFGPRFTLDVFENCGPIFIARSTNPRCSDLQELVTLCKGKVVTSVRMAQIVIGEYVDEEGVTCLTETWVLDCITFNKKVSFKSKYLIEKPVVTKSGRLSIAV